MPDRRPRRTRRTALVGLATAALLAPAVVAVAAWSGPSDAAAAARTGDRRPFPSRKWRPRPRPTPPPVSAPVPVAASTAPSATSPAAATSSVPPASPTTPATTPAAGVPGVAFDPRLVPAGDPGSTAFRIVRTGELPTPSGDGTGNFRTVCAYSHMNNDDPIVAPLRLGASHLHVFWGNTKTDATSTAASLATSGGSTCRGGTANRTAYWAPAVIDTRTGAPQAPALIHVYYKSGYYGIAPGELSPLPDGLRMIAGSSTATGPQDHAGWRCWDAGTPVQATIPACTAGDFVTMTLDFPQCWNGRDLDSADHKSHMAFPVGGRCPASHPVAVPVVSYNVLYPVTASTDTRGWRLSSDTYAASSPGGYSVHGDWFDGWDPAVKRTWTAGCVNRPVTCGSHMLGDGRVMQGDV